MDNLTRPGAAEPSHHAGSFHSRWRGLARSAPVLLAFLIALAGVIAAPGAGFGSVRGGTPVLLGSWTVHFIPSTLNAQGQNIRRPAQIINGTVLAPGATFNFARAAGPFTQANGYGSGGAIVGGVIKPDAVIGGGLCSAATT
ncbi:MAG: VanW family protein, partial [Candidatus Limnocylindrales bacterium]